VPDHKTVAMVRRVGTVAALVEARRGDRHPGLLFDDRTWSWDEVVVESTRRAWVLDELRHPARPFHVGVMLENVPEYLFLLFGAALCGAALVGVNLTRRGEELGEDIRHTDCQLLLVDEASSRLLADVDVGLSPERVLRVDDAVWERRVAAAPGDRAPESVAVGPSTLYLLLFTSGTTGAPKAVVCTQGRLADIAHRSAQGFGIRRDDVLYEAMPLFHGNAIMANVAPALAVGATIALRERFSASRFAADLVRYNATYCNYVGRALAYVLAQPPSDLERQSRLRLAFGTEATARDIEEFERRFGCKVLETYGSSEGVIAMHRPPGTPRAAMGVPQPGMDVIVADPTTGEECERARFDAGGRLINPDRAIGEIVRRDAEGRFEGYYRNEEAERERLRGSWYWSGDLAFRDEAGFFYFAGRKSDWLRVDSENFAAAPVERILGRCDGVLVAAVYPVPDPRTGDQVMAALELEPKASFDPEQFGRFLAAQPDLGTKWAPRFVRLVERMPVTANNKVDKQPLRRAFVFTDDPLYWRPGRELVYEAFTDADRNELVEQFEANGRAHLLGIG
jgi:fatty-acyl-CoA synthase